jgi:hypothetical protein
MMNPKIRGIFVKYSRNYCHSAWHCHYPYTLPMGASIIFFDILDTFEHTTGFPEG